MAAPVSGYGRQLMSPLRHRDQIFVAWSAARAEANLAYDAWCSEPGEDAYFVYRAAEDRADAAERDLIAVSRLLLTA